MITVVAAGDSVVWGQGLSPGQKFHALAARDIAANLGLAPSEVRVASAAHSGAVIDEPGLPAPLDQGTRLWQEVPHHSPTIMSQLDQLLPRPGQPDPAVDLVILGGGLNDVDFRVVLDPLASDAALERKIEQNCYRDTLALLRKARRNFPNAVLVLVGYYPILSEASDLAVARLTAGMLLLAAGPPGPLLAAGAAVRSVRRLRYFHRRQLSWSRRAVREMHASADTRGPGVLFAHPAFGPRNSVGGPAPLLFGPKEPRDLEEAWDRFRSDPLTFLFAIEPGDPQSGQRRRACDALVPAGADRLQCFVASVGHPNPSGARRYADTIAEVVLANRSLSLRMFLRGLLGPASRELSVLSAAGRYALAAPPVSLRDLMQHVTVDVIDVTITTRDVLFAGTDHDVYLRVGPARRWKLNESVFEGDLFDDFERGSTTTYTIDPAEGRPRRRLRLWQVEEVALELRAFAPVDAWRPGRVRVAFNGREVLDSAVREELSARNPRWKAPDYPRGG